MVRALPTILVLGLAATIVGTTAEATHFPWPAKMVALGDSITRATNVGTSSSMWLDNPEHSWSTGYSSSDVVLSHYERIRSSYSPITNQNYNDAWNGADMADFSAQADTAVSRGAKYVTVLLGANDVCASSKDSMTPVDTFRTQFRTGASKLKSGLPAGAVVYVSSIPDIYQLWKLYRYDWKAQSVWASFDICQSMLDINNSETTRQFVRQRNIDFNTVLQQESAAYGFRWDGKAVFNYQFAKSDVSKLDYFHPSLDGQKNLATVTWNAGPYAS